MDGQLAQDLLDMALHGAGRDGQLVRDGGGRLPVRHLLEDLDLTHSEAGPLRIVPRRIRHRSLNTGREAGGLREPVELARFERVEPSRMWRSCSDGAGPVCTAPPWERWIRASAEGASDEERARGGRPRFVRGECLRPHGGVAGLFRAPRAPGWVRGAPGPAPMKSSFAGVAPASVVNG